jgi:hypothetical protein
MRASEEDVAGTLAVILQDGTDDAVPLPLEGYEPLNDAPFITEADDSRANSFILTVQDPRDGTTARFKVSVIEVPSG